MRHASRAGSLVAVLMTAFSLISIIAAFQLDTIVNVNLYSYELQFSLAWGIPYWTAIRTIFAVALLNIITAVALQTYIMTRKTKEKAGEPKEPQEEVKLEKKEHWHTYNLSDGATIKVEHKLKSAKRLDKYSPDGIPIYVVDYDNIVQVLCVPEKLTKQSKEPPTAPQEPLKKEKSDPIQMFAAKSSDFEQAEEQKKTEIAAAKGRKRRRKRNKQKH